MKRLLFIPLLFLMVGQAIAVDPAFLGMMKGQAAAPACAYTLRDKQETTNDHFPFGNTSARIQASIKIVKSGTNTIGRISFFMSKTTNFSAGRTLTAYICSDNAGVASTTCTQTTTGTLDYIGINSTVKDSDDWVSWDFSSYPMSDTGVYHIKMVLDSYDSSAYFLIGEKSSTSGEWNHVSADGTTWSVIDNNEQGDFRLYSCE